MSCPICISNYNKSTCAEITCQCEYSACKLCVRRYLLTTLHEPHCMHCRNQWSLEFIKKSLGASFVNGDLKEHQRKILLESTIAKREERMAGAIMYRDDRIDRERIRELQKKADVLRKEYSKIMLDIDYIENLIKVRHGEPTDCYTGNRERIKQVEVKKPTLIMPCQNSNCKGMLNEKYSCVLCNITTCSSCFEPKNADHTCDANAVETAKMLKRDTKPCPKCGVRISKIDGCDQMWCVECKTAFSWNTGIIETNYIHNPHYYQYMRERGMVPNERPAAQCEDIRYIRSNALNRLYRNNNIPSTTKDKFTKYIEYVNHIKQVTVEKHEEHITANTNNLENEYLYILGELDKEILGDRLMTASKKNQKNQAFLDIYRAIGLMADQICQDILGETNMTVIKLNKIYHIIERWSAYFNMELIKALMLHDSKREIEIFDNWNKTNMTYASKTDMMSACERYSTIYNSADSANDSANASANATANATANDTGNVIDLTI